jgi:carbon storage regulator
MLVLTRRRSESIKIGNEVVIKVIETRRGMVRLGIEAPSHVRVLRGELTEFADSPVIVSATDTDAPAALTDGENESNSAAEEERSIDFTTEYAMEIESQIECAAAGCR